MRESSHKRYCRHALGRAAAGFIPTLLGTMVTGCSLSRFPLKHIAVLQDCGYCEGFAGWPVPARRRHFLIRLKAVAQTAQRRAVSYSELVGLYGQISGIL